MQGVEQARREFIYRDFADPESRAGAARQQRMLTAVASGSLGAFGDDGSLCCDAPLAMFDARLPEKPATTSSCNSELIANSMRACEQDPGARVQFRYPRYG
jgi:hypothetical protein